MPKRKYARSGVRLRSTRRRSKKRVKIIKPRVPLNGVKSSEIAKLRYVDTITIPATSTGLGLSHLFRANSLFDPDFTGVGHQPMGFDQLAARFNHYQVLGARIKVTLVPLSSASTGGDQPSWILVHTKDDANDDYTYVNGALESRRYGKMKKMFASNYMFNNLPDDVGRKVLTATFKPTRMYGQTKKGMLSNDNLKAPVNANPLEVAFFHILAYPADPGVMSTRDSVNLLVEIDYTAKFTEPKDIAQS